MGVLDGQAVSAAITNPAFINKNQNDTMGNILGFNRALSGTSIADIQQAVNNIYSATGVSESQSGTVYDAPPSTIDNGDPYQTALYKLAAKFDAVTGHTHDGTDGSGGPITSGDIMGVPLLGYIQRSSDLMAVTGGSTVVTTAMTGKTPSSNSTTLGVPVMSPNNQVRLLDPRTGYEFIASTGGLVYGRITFSAMVWTLTYYSILTGVETAYSFSTATDISWFYQELFNPLDTTSVYNLSNQLFGNDGGVQSIAASGNTPLIGNVILAAGTGVSLSQVGQVISIAATGGGGGVTTPLELQEIATPSTPPSGYGSIYFKSDGFLYQLNDDGTETKVGSGTSGINYILNPDAESNTLGWATYADAAGNIPVNGTGGTATGLTFSRSTSSPLVGTAQFSMVQANSTSLQGKGVSYDFTIDRGYQASNLAIEFNFNASSTFVASNGSTPPLNDGTTSTNAGNSDIEVFMYDVTNAILIPVSPQVIVGNGPNNFIFKGIFQASSNSTSYRLILHVATTSNNATGWTFLFDNVFVGPQPILQGPPVTDWTPYSLVIAGASSNPTLGTTSLNQAMWRRVGDSIQIAYSLRQTGAGSAGSGNYLFPLPPGLTIDANKIPIANSSGSVPVVGSGTVQTTGGGIYEAYVTLNGIANPSSLVLAVVWSSTIQEILSSATTGANLGSTSPQYSFIAEVPVTGWSSNVLMSTDTASNVVAFSAYKSSTSGGLSGTVDVVCDTVLKDTNGTYNPSTGVYTIPVSGWYTHKGNVRSGTGTTGQASVNIVTTGSVAATNTISTQNVTTGLTYSVSWSFAERYYVAGDTVKAQFTNTGYDIQGGSTLTYISMARVAGPATIASTDNVFLLYRSSSGTALTANVTNNSWATKVADSHSAWSGTVFTAPRSGFYLISGAISTTTNIDGTFLVYVNGSTTYVMSAVGNGVTHGQYCFNTLGIPLVAGDTISIRSDTNVTTGTGAANNWISIWSQ